MRRKRYQKRKKQRRGVLGAWVLLISMAVGTGFVGSKYVVMPWMKGDVEVSIPMSTEEREEPKEKEEEEEVPNSTVVEGQIQTVKTTAYAVQMGSFSTEEAAKERVKELKAENIEGMVQQRDGMWKVVAGEFSTKDEARAMAVKWRDLVGDAFVVEN